jgi:hypothetical protein
MTQKSLILMKERKKYWNMFNDNYMFDDEQFYLEHTYLYQEK